MKNCFQIALWMGVPLLLALAPRPAHAQDFSLHVACTSSGQLCSPAGSATVTVATPSSLGISITTVGGCSDAEFYFAVDGTQVGVTPFLSPDQTSSVFNTATLTAGTHTVTAQAQGEVEGCNTGNLQSWAATLHVTTVAATTTAPSAAPMQPRDLGLIALGLLAVAVLMMRRNRNALLPR